MRIAVGSDHRGFETKQQVISLLTDLGHDYHDFGCYDMNSVDYPDIARAVGEAIASKKYEFGILFCGTGIGMSIAANKLRGIRAALCRDTLDAYRSRAHNDANVLCIGVEAVDRSIMADIISTFLSTAFENDRHTRRLEKIEALEAAVLDNQ